MQSRKNGQKHIWVLSGTGEGPLLASALVDEGWEVTVSVVSDSASLSYLEISLTSILVGPLQGVEGIKSVLDEAVSLHNGFDWVIDATHPFAVEISANLYKACKEFGQSLLCFERPMEAAPGVCLIKDIKDLSTHSLNGRNLLMAIGARHLGEAVSTAHEAGAKVYARVLPTPKSLKQSLLCSLPECALAVIRPLQGSQKGSIERALCRRWSISDVICRQSGGVTEKLWQDICNEEKIKLWLITRPALPKGVEVVHTFNTLLERVETFK